MWLPNEGTLDFFNLSLLLPICPFDLVLSSEHLHCKKRMYLNIYFEVSLLLSPADYNANNWTLIRLLPDKELSD